MNAERSLTRGLDLRDLAFRDDGGIKKFSTKNRKKMQGKKIFAGGARITWFSSRHAGDLTLVTLSEAKAYFYSHFTKHSRKNGIIAIRVRKYSNLCRPLGRVFFCGCISYLASWYRRSICSSLTLSNLFSFVRKYLDCWASYVGLGPVHSSSSPSPFNSFILSIDVAVPMLASKYVPKKCALHSVNQSMNYGPAYGP